MSLTIEIPATPGNARTTICGKETPDAQIEKDLPGPLAWEGGKNWISLADDDRNS